MQAAWCSVSGILIGDLALRREHTMTLSKLFCSYTLLGRKSEFWLRGSSVSSLKNRNKFPFTKKNFLKYIVRLMSTGLVVDAGVQPQKVVIQLYFRNQLTRQYKRDEAKLMQLTNSHLTPTQKNSSFNLIGCYKSVKLLNFPSEIISTAAKTKVCKITSCTNTNA